MILGVGLDIVHVDRIRKWKEIPGILNRYYHPDEIRSALPKGKTGILSLAARFAAKEAFGKALGTGMKNFSLKEIAVMNDCHGKPIMYLYGKAEKAFLDFGGGKIYLSLTHESNNALAVVIIEEV